ncbi:unnamed protein product, partial [Effrenium voratum]
RASHGDRWQQWRARRGQRPRGRSSSQGRLPSALLEAGPTTPAEGRDGCCSARSAPGPAT